MHIEYYIIQVCEISGEFWL